METVSPMLKAGWTWYQNADSAYWNVQLKPYLETQMSLTSDFMLKRLISMLTTVQMTKFKTNAFYSFTFGTTG